VAPPSLQEDYDNAGLLTGNPDTTCTGVLVALDVTEEVILEAAGKKCNLVVAHHPLIFRGLRSLTGNNFVERTVIRAIQQDMAVYAVHTNLDNVLPGVNGAIAQQLDLRNVRVLRPRERTLEKLVTFCPGKNAGAVREALFRAGAGTIGNYSECSFNVSGSGTFKAAPGAHPHVGTIGELHHEEEIRIEVIFPTHARPQLVAALRQAHPYEEPAYDLYPLNNTHSDTGSGVIGELPADLDEAGALRLLKNVFRTGVIRHTPLRGQNLRTIAVCGGSGRFLLPDAIRAGAGLYVTSDLKYHEFFDADGRIVLADIGHYESEQFTIGLIVDILRQKFPTFAVLKTETNTNPVTYFV